jgi:hypothetical protein
MDTERLAGEFIARTLPKNQWTHEAHLRVGLRHSLPYPCDAALALLWAFLASVDSGRPADELAQKLIARLGWLEPDLEPLPGA